MPRYFFHAEDGRVFHDDEGTELPNDAAARIEAVKIAGQLIEEDPALILDTCSMRLTVSNEDTLTVFLIDASAVKPPALGTSGGQTR
jgi:hypothetical protein